MSGRPLEFQGDDENVNLIIIIRRFTIGVLLILQQGDSIDGALQDVRYADCMAVCKQDITGSHSIRQGIAVYPPL